MQGRGPLWMSRGPCAEASCCRRRCKTPVFLLRDPRRRRYGMTLELECLFAYYCAQRWTRSRSSKDSRTCRSSPGCIRSRFLCGGCPCRRPPRLSPSPARQPPSNNESQACSPCTVPGEVEWMKRQRVINAWFITAVLIRKGPNWEAVFIRDKQRKRRKTHFKSERERLKEQVPWE